VLKPSAAQITHTAIAIGTGIGVFLSVVAANAHNVYVQGGAVAGIATLGALGVGVAKRSTP